MGGEYCGLSYWWCRDGSDFPINHRAECASFFACKYFLTTSISTVLRHFIGKKVFLYHYVPQNLWSSNIFRRVSFINVLNLSKSFSLCWLWSQPQYFLRWRLSGMWTAGGLYYLGFLQKVKTGLCNTLIWCIGSLINSGYGIFKLSLPASFRFLLFTLDHTKFGYFSISSV